MKLSENLIQLPDFVDVDNGTNIFITVQFIESERKYSSALYESSNTQNLFKSSEFVQAGNEYNVSTQPLEKLKEDGLSNSVSPTSRFTSSGSSDSETETGDSLKLKSDKLNGPDISIGKMQQRRDSASINPSKYEYKKFSFEDSVEPAVNFESNLDTDEENVVFTNEVVYGSTNDHYQLSFMNDSQESIATKGSLKRLHTIATDSDIRNLTKSVTIDESVRYIEPRYNDVTGGCFYLDDDTSANIRRKLMAYSLLEADSDCFDKNASKENKPHTLDNFNIATALVDNGDTSTETESTIVSAVTKIQAGTRGYLTRKRLCITYATSDCKSTAKGDCSKASFGNAAISESLEYLLQETAAKRIQAFYRKFYKRKHQEDNNIPRQPITSFSATSVESSLAQKRSMLQRGDAVRNNSTPDDDSSASHDSGCNKHIPGENMQIDVAIEKPHRILQGK